jgi:superfamily II DNA or RNA helicase
MVSEGVDIKRLRVVVYATNIIAELSFRQIVGRVVRSNVDNSPNDFGIVYLPADPRLVQLGARITGTSAVKLHRPIVVDETDPRKLIQIVNPDGTLRGEFRPLASEGSLGIVTDVTGRQAPAYLVELAQRYIDATGSQVPAFELALLAWTDETLRRRLIDTLGGGEKE